MLNVAQVWRILYFTSFYHNSWQAAVLAPDKAAPTTPGEII